ncbi:septal ring lytic transglycosylase RlpA family protein [Arachidicoccus sp.]|uniref:septal ring lytic transglycosylase RlpA family protein n=1 Tax=Arachidicoccus sp. TaxID=1872624 RepID=UPI003D1B9A8A
MKKAVSFCIIFSFSIALFSCAKYIKETGKASYYAGKFIGRKTANGETFRKRKLTAASKTLPFGTRVKVTNLSNGRSVKVRINDRGPFVKGRILDLSWKAAKRIDMLDAGVVSVRLKYRKPQ